MKRYKVFGRRHSDPMRLIASVILAFVVMLFINGFIGSMGGFPAFIAFMLTFYRLRTVSRIREADLGKPDVSKEREIAWLMADYSLRYLFMWAVFRIGLFFSRVTGWGNIRGMSALEYVKDIFATSMLEKWAYLFAGILMFAFVLSLFPRVVIRQKPQWMLYALLDGAGFAILCTGLNAICLNGIESGKRGRATCLIDDLLLCRNLQTGQEILFLVLILLFTIAEGVFVFFYSRREYGRISVKEKKIRWRLEIIAILVCGVAAVGIVVVMILFMPEDSTDGYVKVAEFLTKDEILGPMEYGRTIYVPVDEELELDENGTPQGYLAGKNEECDSRFYRLAVANLLYTDDSGRTNRVQMKGESEGVYVPVEELETRDAWQDDDVFLIWDEDWSSESTYYHEPTGYTTCNADLIEGLMMQFPQVTYRPSDFEDYDAYFTIRAYQNMDQISEHNTVSGDWVGCILIKDDRFYFGSYENEITGICLQELHEVLGGN
jgi:hypothetical protein